MAEDLLQVSGLDAFYGPTQVLFDVSFRLRRGEITAILGANGAGKTTTLRAICQAVRTRGSIRLGGEEIIGRTTESVVRMGVAHVPDGRGTFSALTVEENLRLGAISRRLHGSAGRRELEHDMERLFARFPILKARRQQQAGTLSGGEQQMLAISRALMLRPRLLLLDEPSFGLAPLIVAEIFDIMRAINRDEGVSMLLVEQNANLALDLSHQAYLLETGHVALSGPSAEIRSNESVRKSYLGY
jgi:branched-chain amino acid transport system ATP-binding protein